ncbi:sigma-70 family RNA polymerase sigma factor [Xylocopilactobacillus apicola]|uniref:RNA polymerase sigma-70 region 2 domain-containing protein n=1 Tax=Xylocopilactobacillus apicola TaxID=2932184 RepID=A0AAU9D6M7_9LACO|nr:sigma-70 family RNA polymerase sigma factor [Xylocopilactobacillus apicola]BDR59203.1 hypothetical protein XA3_16440 [Xylocopilactobacillus apicola]
MDDQQTAAAIKNRDESVFNELVNHYSKLLWAVAYSVLGKQTSSSEVKELVTDVFWRFWQHPAKYDSTRGSLKNYLALMTKSMALNKLRDQNDPTETDDFILETIPAPQAKNDLVWQILFAALETLTEPTKRICFERFFMELKPAVISKNLNLSLTEVNNRLYQGKKKIKPIMQQLMEREDLL